MESVFIPGGLVAAGNAVLYEQQLLFSKYVQGKSGVLGWSRKAKGKRYFHIRLNVGCSVNFSHLVLITGSLFLHGFYGAWLQVNTKQVNSRRWKISCKQEPSITHISIHTARSCQFPKAFYIPEKWCKTQSTVSGERLADKWTFKGAS